MYYLTIKFLGILASLNFAGYLSGSIFSIFVKDINFKVYLYRFGIFLAISTTFILAYSDNNTLWMIGRVLAGFAGAMCLIVGTSIVMQKLTIKSKTKAMGIHFQWKLVSHFNNRFISKICSKFELYMER